MRIHSNMCISFARKSASCCMFSLTEVSCGRLLTYVKYVCQQDHQVGYHECVGSPGYSMRSMRGGLFPVVEGPCNIELRQSRSRSRSWLMYFRLRYYAFYVFCAWWIYFHQSGALYAFYAFYAWWIYFPRWRYIAAYGVCLHSVVSLSDYKQEMSFTTSKCPQTERASKLRKLFLRYQNVQQKFFSAGREAVCKSMWSPQKKIAKLWRRPEKAVILWHGYPGG
jgi:hypothetical protein